jgi:hypothetical protein
VIIAEEMGTSLVEQSRKKVIVVIKHVVYVRENSLSKKRISLSTVLRV